MESEGRTRAGVRTATGSEEPGSRPRLKLRTCRGGTEPKEQIQVRPQAKRNGIGNVEFKLSRCI